MITARTVLLAAVVLASWVLASTIGAALSEGKTYGGARVKVPNSITVGKRFLVKASRFPPNAKLVLRAVPYAQRGGNCCGVIISQAKRASATGNHRFSVRFPFRYHACMG